MKTIRISGKLDTGTFKEKLFRSDLNFEGQWEIALGCIGVQNKAKTVFNELIHIISNISRENQWVGEESKFEETQSVPLKTEAFLLKPKELTCRQYGLIWHPINSITEWFELSIVQASSGELIVNKDIYTTMTFFLRRNG